MAGEVDVEVLQGFGGECRKTDLSPHLHEAGGSEVQRPAFVEPRNFAPRAVRNISTGTAGKIVTFPFCSGVPNDDLIFFTLFIWAIL